MTLDEVLDRLYESEINVSISWIWDGGFELKLGDKLNGFDAESRTTIKTSAEAAAWLDQTARRLYPQSEYATRKRADDRSR
jgi:hypothetical protein